MNGPIALGGACLTAAGVGMVWLARLWPSSPRPARGGRHRAAPAAVSEPLLRPVEAMAHHAAWCPVEHRVTLHLEFTTGGLMCLDCRRREA